MFPNPNTKRHWKTPDLTTYPPFGEWTVLRFMGYHQGNAFWECRCSCGTVKNIAAFALLRQQTKSCGHGIAAMLRTVNVTHGMSYSPERKAWSNMVQRCTNPHNKNYFRYGARGITVCEAWQTFEGFYADMGNMPAPGLTLERLSNAQGYKPGNVKWGTHKEQAVNRSSTVFLTYRGETLCAKDWALRLGLTPATFRWRVRQGWSIEHIIDFYNISF